MADPAPAPDARATASIAVRPARREDVPELVRFNAAMALETEGRALDAERLTGGVCAVFEDPTRGAYWVAERAGATVGALLVTREWSDWRNGWFWWIQSVYVPREQRGQGVYRALYEHLTAAARSAGDVCGLRLYVELENRAAQSVYERLGMERARYALYEVDFVLGRHA